MKETLYWCTIYFFEITKLWLVIFELLKCRINKYRYLFLGGFIFIVAIKLFYICVCKNAKVEDLTYVVGCLSMFMTALALKEKNKIPLVIIGYFMICLVDLVPGGILLLLLKSNYRSVYDNFLYMSVGNAMSIPIFAVITILCKKRHIHICYILKKMKWKYLFLIFLGIVGYGLYIAPIQVIGIAHDGSLKMHIFAFGVSISGIVFLTICMLLLSVYYSKIHFQSLYIINNKLIKQQEQYYLTVINNNNNIRKFMHDVDNHINCLLYLCNNKNYDKVVEYLNQIQGSFEGLKMKIATGNAVVNAIVSDILNKNTEIELKWSGMLPENIKITSMDLCIIFSNLLSNAVEAVYRNKSDIKKIITVSIKCINNNIMIKISNPVESIIPIYDNNLHTSKRDGELHGIGSVNIKECIEKYFGSLRYICKDNIFFVEIIFLHILNE